MVGEKQMSINDRKKVHIILTSVLDLVYVLLLFKIGGKVDFLNNLSYLIILSGIVVPILLCLVANFFIKSYDFIVIQKSETIWVVCFGMFLLKLSGMSALSNVSYWFVLSPVLITSIVVLIGLIMYICLDIDVVEKYKNILGINKSQDLNF